MDIVRNLKSSVAAVASIFWFAPVSATQQYVEDTSIASVMVNGGADTVNPGTTCIQITSGLPAACAGGFVAIPNNNRQLVATALLSKTNGQRVWLYFDDATGSNHCPGLVFTPCSVISIGSK